MARRTKEEAQETRDHILDTAERVFLKAGVSRASLENIAEAAGVTRGAIYWHFKNKADLFEAMMQRVSLPMEGIAASVIDDVEDPLSYVRSCALNVLAHVTADPQSRRVQEICHYKVEYVDEMEQLRDRHIECRTSALARVERGMRSAAKKGQLASWVDPRLAAVGLHAMVSGLIQNWVLNPKYLALSKSAEALIDAYLNGIRAVGANKQPAAHKARARRRSSVLRLPLSRSHRAGASRR
jgi:TetR/AcrR family transcriptional regulator, acrAB operon repressor